MQDTDTRQMTTKTWDGKSYGTPLGYKIFIASIRFLGLRFSYALLVIVSVYYWIFRKKSRESTKDLRKKYILWQKKDKVKLGLFFPFRRIFIFGQVLIDRVAVFFQIKFYLRETGVENLQNLLQTGGIILGAHLGNWEAGLSILKDKKDLDTHVAMSIIEGDFLQKILQKETNKFVSIIPLDHNHDSMFTIKNRLQEDKVVAMHGDRYFGNMRTMECSFVGEKAHFPIGPYIVAAALQKKICFVSVIKKKWNTYELICSSPQQYKWDKTLSKNEQIHIWLQEYVTFLESQLLHHPEQWFNFYDFWHKK